jgi:hypothetical protein
MAGPIPSVLRAATAGERAEVEKYLSLDIDLLFSLIPPHLPEYQHTFFSPDGQTGAGKKAFDALSPELKRTLCEEWELCKKIDDAALNDHVELVVTIADVIASTQTVVPPFILSTLLVRMGVRRLCKCKPH